MNPLSRVIPLTLPFQGLRVKDEYALPMMARRSIRDELEGDKKEALLEKFKDELLGAEIKLTADYAAIWKELVDAKKVIHLYQSLTDCSSAFLD